MLAFSIILFVITYFPSLMFCCFVSGNLHLKVSCKCNNLDILNKIQLISSPIPSNQIRKAYQPLTNLLANKQLKFPTTVRMVRILEFIKSEHSGIRVGSFFLVRRNILFSFFSSKYWNEIVSCRNFLPIYRVCD